MPFGPEPETGRETKWRFQARARGRHTCQPAHPEEAASSWRRVRHSVGPRTNARGSRRPARAGGSALNRLGASALFLCHGDPLRLPELVNHEVVIPANHDLFHLRVFVFDRDDEPIRLPVRLVILTNREGEHRVASWLAALAKNLELSARAAAGILARFLQLPVDRSVHRLVPRDTFMPGVHARHFT